MAPVRPCAVRAARLGSDDLARHLVVVVAVARQAIEIEGALGEGGVEAGLVAVGGALAAKTADPLVAAAEADAEAGQEAGIEAIVEAGGDAAGIVGERAGVGVAGDLPVPPIALPHRLHGLASPSQALARLASQACATATRVPPPKPPRARPICWPSAFMNSRPPPRLAVPKPE